jgi:hypothetical protein
MCIEWIRWFMILGGCLYSDPTGRVCLVHWLHHQGHKCVQVHRAFYDITHLFIVHLLTSFQSNWVLNLFRFVCVITIQTNKCMGWRMLNFVRVFSRPSFSLQWAWLFCTSEITTFKLTFFQMYHSRWVLAHWWVAAATLIISWNWPCAGFCPTSMSAGSLTILIVSALQQWPLFVTHNICL